MNKLYEEFVAVEHLESHRRGKEFEKIIGIMLSNENLRHSLSYRPEGEEIDGAFIWNTHTFLVEAKWHKEPMPASAIYAFTGNIYLTWNALLQSQKVGEKSVYLYMCAMFSDIIISSLLEYLHDREHLVTESIELIYTPGGTSIPSLIQLLPNETSKKVAILVVVDTYSGDPLNRQAFIQPLINIRQSIPSSWDYHFTLASPDLTWWVGAHAKPGLNITAWIDQIKAASKAFDWNHQIAKNKDIKDIVSFLRSVLPRIPGYP